MSIEKMIGAHHFQCINFGYAELHSFVEFIFDDSIADRPFFIIGMGLGPYLPPM
jgi:hypothetical protein